jgi:hypothetical protein
MVYGILTQAYSLVDAAKARWKSPIYKHYSVSVKRELQLDGSPGQILFCFRCRYDHATHDDQYRARVKTGQGTSNLGRTAEACNVRRISVLLL